MLPLRNYLAAHAALKGGHWSAAWGDWLVVIEVQEDSDLQVRTNWQVVSADLEERFGTDAASTLRFLSGRAGGPRWIDVLIVGAAGATTTVARAWLERIAANGGHADPLLYQALLTNAERTICIDRRGEEQSRGNGVDPEELAILEWYDFPPGEDPPFVWTRWSAVPKPPPGQAALTLANGRPLGVPAPARGYGAESCAICALDGKTRRITTGWHCHWTGEHVCDRHVRVVENEDERIAREYDEAVTRRHKAGGKARRKQG